VRDQQDAALAGPGEGGEDVVADGGRRRRHRLDLGAQRLELRAEQSAHSG